MSAREIAERIVMDEPYITAVEGAINKAIAQARAEALEECARHLEQQPSFGDGKWAAGIVRELKGGGDG